MDRLTQLKGEAGGSRDSTLDSSAALSEAYITASDSSKYFSLGEEDSTYDISPIQDISLASTAAPDKAAPANDQLIPDLSPVPKKNDLLDSYKFGKQIEAANILSGGVNIFDDNDNSYDGNELVIDDNVVEIDEKSNSEMKLMDNAGLPFQKSEESESMDGESAIGSKDTEVVLQIDGKNVQAIDIGNGLYLYRKQGEEELAAVQILADDHDQPTFKFLKVRENAEGNLEVYEEIEIEVPKEVPIKEGKVPEKGSSHVPIKDINKVISDPVSSKSIEKKNPVQTEKAPITSNNDIEDTNKTAAAETKSEINLNGKMIKYNETRKSPVIHSTPNKEGIPLTKTMVALQLHPNRPLDNLKTIEVHTDHSKPRSTDNKNKDFIDDNRQDTSEKQKDVAVTTNDVTETVHCAISNEENNIQPENTPTETLKQDENVKALVEPLKKSKIEPLSAVAESDVDKVYTTNKETEILSEAEVNKNEEIEKSDVFKKTELKETDLKNDFELRESSDTNLCGKDDNKKCITEIIDQTLKQLEAVKSDVKIQNQEMVEQTMPDNKVESSDENILAAQAVGTNDQVLHSKEISISKVTAGPGKEGKSKVESIDQIEKGIKDDNNKIFHKLEHSSPVSVEKSEISCKAQLTNAKILSIKKDECTSQPTIEVKALNNENMPILKQSDATTKIEKNNQSVLAETSSKASDSPPLEIIEMSELSDNKNVVQGKVEVQEKNSQPETKNTQVDNNSVKDKSVEKSAVKNIHLEENTIKVALITAPEMKQSKLVVDKTNELKEDIKFQTKQISRNPVKHIPLDPQPTAAKQKSIKLIPCKQEVVKSDVKNCLPGANTLNPTQSKPDIKSEIPRSIHSNQKPINNNHTAVPFGKWTEANRQEFLNKIKESKVPTNYPNTKSIKQPNDLNRRDVLQKIDSQRQSSNASAKTQELPKVNVKAETVTFAKKPTVMASKVPIKTEVPIEPQINPLPPKNATKPELLRQVPIKTFSKTSNVAATKQEGDQRKEMNNQDLIDKTIEGIINRAVSTKPQEPNLNVPKEPIKIQQEPITTGYKPQEKPPTKLDLIEMKMNELHGIPLVERPPHQLPKVYNLDVKTYAQSDNPKLSKNKGGKLTNLLAADYVCPRKPVVTVPIIDLDSEEEVIEHEPITGDIDLHKKNITKVTAPVTFESVSVHRGADTSKKEPIITEKDFDKFVRRNSITYENCLTMNLEANKQHNVTQALVEKDMPAKISRNELMLADSKAKAANKKLLLSQTHSNKFPVTSKLMPVNDEALNKNYPSKLQMAYTALTAKRKMESPITIIEDKPVKVVFMDSTLNFPSGQLNVQGKELSPSKKLAPEPVIETMGTSDSLDSDLLDTVDDGKVQDETKVKTKHQRKQVLTPVEAPELELFVPSDNSIDGSPKRKRKTDDFKLDKIKNVVPKKTYLLGRGAVPDNPEPPNLSKIPLKETITENNTVISHKDAASAIDNLVKAAELLETQSETLNLTTSVASSESSPIGTPVKRGRGRPRKYPLPEGTTPDKAKEPSPQKKPRLIEGKQKKRASTTDDDYTSDDEMIKENWTMGKINENIVCPICNKLFRSENVVFKHVKHCTGPSPSRSDSDKRSPRRSRLSRESDTKSMESVSDDMEIEPEKTVTKKNTPKKRKSKELSSHSRDEVIVIEDTPIKAKPDKNEEPKQHESRRTKAQYKSSTLSCEHCGKTFRQLSYLVSHKLLHKKESAKVPENDTQSSEKSVFSCEVCKKEFRKLHHLVQHRIIHNPNNPPRPSRKSSSEQSSDNKVTKEQDLKQSEDPSAAFRCEPCDKSFRKLHHLVEHRETHDGINRQKNTGQATAEKPAPNPPPQCDICMKTFRKLHHLIEHKEQHAETGSDKSDDKSVKSALSAKDIIHECSLCYMVFPNEHSLTKHTVICQRKKRQSALKQAKLLEERKLAEGDETKNEDGIDTESEPIVIEETDAPTVTIQADKEISIAAEPKPEPLLNKQETAIEIKEKRLSKGQETIPVELRITESKKDIEEPIDKKVEVVPVVPDDSGVKEVKLKGTPKRKAVKDKSPASSAVRRRKSSNVPLARIKETAVLESSDDDEIRYMLNPDFKEKSSSQAFMEVRAQKRSSLQFERPNSKDLVKRRTSLQHPPKIPRLKSKEIDATSKPVSQSSSKAVKTELVPSTDSDDSDVKYSFPEKPLQSTEPQKTPKEKRKSHVEKRKTLTALARRKSLVATKQKQKTIESPGKQIKRRRTEVEHRCDCGQLFSSAALLARHASLAHTPPRVRRRRASPPAAPPAPAAKPTDTRKSTRSDPADSKPEARKSAAPKQADSRKSTRDTPAKAGRTPARKPGRPPAEPPAGGTAAKTRKMAAHRGVPVPEKMRKLMEKLRK